MRIYRAIDYSFLQILKKPLSFQAFFVLQNIKNQATTVNKIDIAFLIHVTAIHSSYKL